MIRKIIQITIQVFLFSFFSSAWGACEAEIERAIQADADYAAPQIEAMRRSNPGSRVETVSERKTKKREMWNAIVNEYKTGGREVAAAKLRSWTETLSRYDRSSSNLGSRSAIADSLTNICLANASLSQTTSSPNSAATPMACAAEIDRSTRSDPVGQTLARERIMDSWKHGMTLSKEQIAQNIRSETNSLNDARRYNYPERSIHFYEMHICVWNAALNGLSPGGARQVFNSQPSQQQQAGANQPQPSNLTQQAQQTAQQNQSRADQQRQGKRKTNDPAAQAHECVAIDQAGSGNFGAFKNTCGYKVNFTTCNFKPRTIEGGFNWSADFNCEKQQFGLHTPDSGRSVAAHNRNTEMVYWFACKAPATPVDAEFVVGKGIEARCHN